MECRSGNLKICLRWFINWIKKIGSVQNYKQRLEQRYWNYQMQKTNDTLILEVQLYKNRLLTLHKGTRKSGYLWENVRNRESKMCWGCCRFNLKCLKSWSGRNQSNSRIQIKIIDKDIWIIFGVANLTMDMMILGLKQKNMMTIENFRIYILKNGKIFRKILRKVNLIREKQI